MRVRLCGGVGGVSSRNRKESSRLEQARRGKAAAGVGNLRLAPVLLGLEDTGESLDLTLKACLREGIFQTGPEKPHRLPFEERG